MNTEHIDKNSFKHAGICFALAATGGIKYGGIQAAIAASVTKEWFDKQSYGHWCWWDLTFDILGMVAGEVVHFFTFKEL